MIYLPCLILGLETRGKVVVGELSNLMSDGLEP